MLHINRAAYIRGRTTLKTLSICLQNQMHLRSNTVEIRSVQICRSQASLQKLCRLKGGGALQDPILFRGIGASISSGSQQVGLSPILRLRAHTAVKLEEAHLEVCRASEFTLAWCPNSSIPHRVQVRFKYTPDICESSVAGQHCVCSDLLACFLQQGV